MISSSLIICIAVLPLSLVKCQGFPKRKSWWAKSITSDLYTAGRLTETQIKYASEDGFKSLVSLPTMSSSTQWGEPLPANQDIKAIAEQSNMQYATVNDAGVSWATSETVQRFIDIYRDLPKPVLFHCYTARSSSLIAMLYLISSKVPNWDANKLYKKAAVMGYNYYSDSNTKRLIEIIADEKVEDPDLPDTTITNWNAYYWWMKPLYKNWFVSGQMQSNHLVPIENAGIQSVVNARRGVTVQPGQEKSQEEATLLNIKDRTGTYTGTGRQTAQELVKNRIDASKSNSYVSPDSPVNYQSRNPLQFGDDIGYNETLERIAVEARSTYQYLHTPVGGQYTYNTDLHAAFKDIWRAADNQGPVLYQCRTGYRSTVLGLLAVGTIYNKSLEWALERASFMGYPFVDNQATNIINLLNRTLPFDYKSQEQNNDTNKGISNYTEYHPLVYLYMFIMYLVTK